MTFIVVDLPLALPPSRQTMRPAADFERQIEMGLHGAVERVDAVEAQQRLVHATGSGCGAAPPMPEWPR